MTGRAQADDVPVLDRAAFDDFAGLFEAGEMLEMLGEWRADCAGALERIADGLRGGDRAVVGEAAHRMAGGALALGATGLARRCEGLRAAAESGGALDDGDVARLRTHVDATLALMTAAVAARDER